MKNNPLNRHMADIDGLDTRKNCFKSEPAFGYTCNTMQVVEKLEEILKMAKDVSKEKQEPTETQKIYLELLSRKSDR